MTLGVLQHRQTCTKKGKKEGHDLHVVQLVVVAAEDSGVHLDAGAVRCAFLIFYIYMCIKLGLRVVYVKCWPFVRMPW